jgi:hypothetical protein
VLGDSDVFAARTLGALTAIECYRLAFAELVERGRRARGVVEEVLVTIAGQNKAEPFVADESFDRAVHWCHSVSLSPAARSLHV